MVIRNLSPCIVSADFRQVNPIYEKKNKDFILRRFLSTGLNGVTWKKINVRYF